MKKAIEKAIGEEILKAFKQTSFKCLDRTCANNGTHLRFYGSFECILKEVAIGGNNENGHWCSRYIKAKPEPTQV